MRFVKIPNIKNTWGNVRIETLSPSMFSWVQTGCSYQILLQRALDSFKDNKILLPASKSTLVGTIIHKIYELASIRELCSLKDLSAKWEELIEIQEERIRSNYPTLLNVDLNDYDKRNKCFRIALSLINDKSRRCDSTDKTKTFSEYWIDCSEIGLRGIVDKLRITNNGLDIIDYKSGSVVDDDGSIKKEYITQLHLYALMCVHQNLGVIKSLSLIDMDGRKYSVEYDERSNSTYLAQVQQTISNLNQVIINRDFDKVSRPCESCSFCSVRHICEKKSVSQHSIYTDVAGIVKRVISPNLFEIESFLGELCSVSGLEVYEIDNPEQYVSKKLSFVNILNTNLAQTSNSYKITNNTIIYEL